jgi:hypothetical protein
MRVNPDMIGDNIMPTDESEPELFVELMYRFMSAKHRLRVAVNDIVGSTHFVLEQHKSAYFVMQEATDDLEKIYKDLSTWGDTQRAHRKGPGNGQLTPPSMPLTPCR